MRDLRQNHFVRVGTRCYRPATEPSTTLAREALYAYLQASALPFSSSLSSVSPVPPSLERRSRPRPRLSAQQTMAAPGLAWREVSEAERRGGVEMRSAKLSRALSGGKRDFTQEEFDHLDVRELRRPDCYIRASTPEGDRYFCPAAPPYVLAPTDIEMQVAKSSAGRTRISAKVCPDADERPCFRLIFTDLAWSRLASSDLR